MYRQTGRDVREDAADSHDSPAWVRAAAIFEQVSLAILPYGMGLVSAVCLWGAIAFASAALLLLSIAALCLAGVVSRWL